MTSTITRKAYNLLRHFRHYDMRYEPVKNTFEFSFNLSIIGVGLISHLTYALGTSVNDKSIIVKKYTMVRNGFTDFMIIDDKGRHFNVNNSLWYWKWNSIEEWHNLNEGDELEFKYYGWRWPVFGLFPNVYRIGQNNHIENQPLIDKIKIITKKSDYDIIL